MNKEYEIAKIEDLMSKMNNIDLNIFLLKNSFVIIFDDYDGDYNRIIDIKDDSGERYHFINGYYDDSWW